MREACVLRIEGRDEPDGTRQRLLGLVILRREHTLCGKRTAADMPITEGVRVRLRLGRVESDGEQRVPRLEVRGPAAVRARDGEGSPLSVMDGIIVLM